MKLIDFNNQIVQAVVAAGILLGIHWLTGSLEKGWLSWAVCLPAWIVLIITAMARVNDITATGKRWFVRRLGLILVGAASVSLVAAPLLGYTASYPSWRDVILYYGFTATWLTTPNMPPWWKYVSGEYKLNGGQQA